MENLNIKIR